MKKQTRAEPGEVGGGREGMDNYTCPDCGHYRDTPVHELGCQGKRVDAAADIVGILAYALSAMADPRNETGACLLQWVLRERDRRLAGEAKRNG